MKTIYVLRHAKAELRSESDAGDFDRGLTERGQDNARELGLHLAGLGWRPDLVLCSSARRTRATFALLAEAFSPALEAQFTDKLYLASAGECLQHLQKLKDSAGSAMIIGHNPGLHHLCQVLAPEGNGPAIRAVAMKFPTCALAVIECEVASWQQIAPGAGFLRDYLDRHQL